MFKLGYATNNTIPQKTLPNNFCSCGTDKPSKTV